jgi:hypothetical protein
MGISPDSGPLITLGIDEIDVFEPRLNGGMWGSSGVDGDNLREQKDSDFNLGCQK